MRFCKYCRRWRPASDFYRGSANHCCKEHWAARATATKFGLSLDEYLAMVRRAKGRCAICGKRQKRRLAVDHDHRTGRVRGMLCITCNSWLSLVDYGLLKRALNYLRR